MKTSTAYKGSLSLPLLAPLVVAPLLSAGHGSPLQAVAVVVVGSVISGGIPYSVLALSLPVFLHERTVRQIRNTLLAAPCLMLPVLGIYLGVVDVVMDWPAPRWHYF